MTRIRIGRKLLQGLGALGAGFVTYKAVTSEEGLDIYNVGVARFGRAAIAVSTTFYIHCLSIIFILINSIYDIPL